MYYRNGEMFLLNLISVISAFIFGVGFLYMLMDATIGKIKIFHTDREWYGLQVKDFVFLIIAIVILLSNFDFYKPY